MFSKLIATLSLTVLLAAPAWCQADSRSAGATGEQEHSNQAGTFFDQGSPINFAPVIHQDTPGMNGGHYDLTPEGWADVTNTQGAGAPNGPKLFGASSYSGATPGDSGATNSAPYPGSFEAPSNFALRQIGRRTLPPTRLDSFVYQSNYNDHVYGDEGTNGPPPYDDFEYLINRRWHPDMTTGHPSDAPSAWGTPQ